MHLRCSPSYIWLCTLMHKLNLCHPPTHPTGLQVQGIRGVTSPVVRPATCTLVSLEVDVVDVVSAAHLDPLLLGCISSPFTLEVR
jgi:hypothetical protein